VAREARRGRAVKTRLTDGAGGRVRERLRRGSDAEARIARGLGAPALAAIALSAVG
jgi:hypothetical protein